MNIIKTLDKQAKELTQKLQAIEQNKRLLLQLDAQRGQLEKALAEGKPLRSLRGLKSSASGETATTRNRIFPRGVLSFAVIESMGKGALDIEDIITRAKEHPFLKGKPAAEIESRVYNLVNSSDNLFERVSPGRFKSKGLPQSTLFSNLKKRKAELVEA